MKYNPKVNEAAARLAGFADLHPSPTSATRRARSPGIPVAGHARRDRRLRGSVAAARRGRARELTGILIMRRRLADLGQAHRTRVLVPTPRTGPTRPRPHGGVRGGGDPVGRPGNVDLAKLKAALDERTAGLMLTNPNTLVCSTSGWRR